MTNSGFRSGVFGPVESYEPSGPTCTPNRTYSVVNGVCTPNKLSCPSGEYDIGFSSCISADANGRLDGNWDLDGGVSHADNVDTYGFTGPGQWGATFSYGVVKGIVSCNNTNGTLYVATDEEFSNTATGRYCWIKMTSPAASRWVFKGDYEEAGKCAIACATYGSSNVIYRSDLRSARKSAV